MFPLPVWFHYALGWGLERMMAVPMVSVSQVRMLTEGLAESTQPCDAMPPEFAPKMPFSEENIRRGLPVAGPFHLRDLNCRRRNLKMTTASNKRAFQKDARLSS